jgi:hypothetical protein
MSLESREFVSMREAQYLAAAQESEKHQRPIERSIGELCEDGSGRVGRCICCGEVAVIPHAQHVGECCSTVGNDE